MIEAPKHLVCWDLDNTLGHFDPFSNEMQGRTRWKDDPDAYLTYGIEDVLAEFSEANGYIAVVTTSARHDYAEYALERAGIRRHFANVYARDVMAPDYEATHQYVGKQYEDVAWEQIPYDEYPDRMVVIGDMYEDNPIDMRDLVHIYSPGYVFDAIVIREALVALLEAGEGSFKKGFDALERSGTKEIMRSTTPPTIYSHVEVGSGVKLTLDRIKGPGPLSEEEGTIPVIYIENPHAFKREPTLIPSPIVST